MLELLIKIIVDTFSKNRGGFPGVLCIVLYTAATENTCLSLSDSCCITQSTNTKIVFVKLTTIQQIIHSTSYVKLQVPIRTIIIFHATFPVTSLLTNLAIC